MTVAHATINKTLFNSSKLSLEIKPNLTLATTVGALSAYSNKEPPMEINSKVRINIPRPGSLANACTLFNTPERTKNVPNKLNENAKMASKTVQLLNAPRFSVTANE